ncbi:hypothetical protein [Pseudomonas rossensis]|uniref:hypothetical protein n=1 Tax=Pseudomonas rossensis TaxID=2305471 RepID=UPI0032604A3E
MDGKKQFAVYSDSREGFLSQTNPSVWHYDAEYAIRFETEKDARRAAGRRHSEDAQAGRLFQVDGVTEFEPLGKVDNAPPGSWVVTIIDPKAPGQTFYLMSEGRVVKMSSSADDAKGYRSERAARKAVDAINGGQLFSAQTHQNTAQVYHFPRS